MTESDDPPGGPDDPLASTGDDAGTDPEGSFPVEGVTRRTYVAIAAGGLLVGGTTTAAAATSPETTSSHGYGQGGYGEGPYRLFDPVDRADADGDGAIDDGELRTAIVDWSAGEYTDGDLRRIVVAWARSG